MASKKADTKDKPKALMLLRQHHNGTFKGTLADISKRTGYSGPSLHNFKVALGLSKGKSSSTSKPATGKKPGRKPKAARDTTPAPAPINYADPELHVKVLEHLVATPDALTRVQDVLTDKKRSLKEESERVGSLLNLLSGKSEEPRQGRARG